MPLGICTMECKESTPSNVEPLTGTPITGKAVMAATIPGRCAAPPAPAIMHLIPALWASIANFCIRRGVAWALTIVSSKGTPNFFKISAPTDITGKSESDPIMTDTKGLGLMVSEISAALVLPNM